MLIWVILNLISVFKRPSYLDFMEFCLENFEVGIWSSRLKYSSNSEMSRLTMTYIMSTFRFYVFISLLEKILNCLLLILGYFVVSNQLYHMLMVSCYHRKNVDRVIRYLLPFSKEVLFYWVSVC